MLRVSLKMPVVNCCWATEVSPALFFFSFFFVNSGYLSTESVQLLDSRGLCTAFMSFWIPRVLVFSRHSCWASQTRFLRAATGEAVRRDTTKSRISPVRELLELNLGKKTILCRGRVQLRKQK